MDHVASEEGLACLCVLAQAHVGQQLFLDDLFGVLYTLGTCDTHCTATLACKTRA
jgi:hypothetical protein